MTCTTRARRAPLWLAVLALAAAACSNSSKAEAPAPVSAPATPAATTPASATVPASATTPAEAPGELRAFTGAPTRAVWVQSDGSDPSAAGDQLVLMGLDPKTGRASA